MVFNSYCYPMKIFEYFYLGVPVISSGILELKEKRFDGLMSIAADYKSWENSIKKLLENKIPGKKQRQQRELAIKNNWQNKIQKIAKALDF